MSIPNAPCPPGLIIWAACEYPRLTSHLAQDPQAKVRLGRGQGTRSRDQVPQEVPEQVPHQEPHEEHLWQPAAHHVHVQRLDAPSRHPLPLLTINDLPLSPAFAFSEFHGGCLSSFSTGVLLLSALRVQPCVADMDLLFTARLEYIGRRPLMCVWTAGIGVPVGQRTRDSSVAGSRAHCVMTRRLWGEALGKAVHVNSFLSLRG